MKSPFYKILMGGEDISEFVQEFDYDASIEKDDLLTIKIQPKVAEEFIDNPICNINTDVVFQFGYIQGKISKNHTAKVTDIEPSYGQGGFVLTIKALDEGNYIKKTSHAKVYNGKTSSQIAKEIADRLGLKADIEETSNVWDFIPTANRSDMEILKYLAKREEDFISYVRNGTLYFKTRGLDKESKLIYTWGLDVISFKPKQKSSGGNGGVSNVKISQPDPYTGIQKVTNVDSKSDSKTVLNSKMWSFNAGDNNLSKTMTNVPKSKTVVNKSQNSTESKNLSKNIQNQGILDSNPVELQTELDPLVEPGDIITMKGVAKKHLGNYQIVSIKYKISGSGATNTCQMKTNGTGSTKGSFKPSGKVNNSVGKDKADNTTKIRIFESNKNKLTT